MRGEFDMPPLPENAASMAMVRVFKAVAGRRRKDQVTQAATALEQSQGAPVIVHIKPDGSSRVTTIPNLSPLAVIGYREEGEHIIPVVDPRPRRGQTYMSIAKETARAGFAGMGAFNWSELTSGVDFGANGGEPSAEPGGPLTFESGSWDVLSGSQYAQTELMGNSGIENATTPTVDLASFGNAAQASQQALAADQDSSMSQIGSVLMGALPSFLTIGQQALMQNIEQSAGPAAVAQTANAIQPGIVQQQRPVGTVATKSGLPSWAIPVGIGAIALVLLVGMKKGR